MATMAPVILAGDNMAPPLLERAAALNVPVDVATVDAEGRIDGDAERVQVLLAAGTLSRARAQAFLREHSGVRWVAALSAGVDAWMLPEVLERDITLTRARHRHDVPVAEFSMALILAAAKEIPTLVLAQQRKEWRTYQPPMLQGKTLTIVGYGEIGRALAHRAKAFEMRVIGVRTKAEPDGLADEVWGSDRLLDAMAESDYTVVAVPGGASRRHLIGETELRALAKHAYFINVGRGEVVDEEALDRLLREEAFAGALIDTFEVEPLPRESPLWTNPRVLVTAHAAGLRAAPLMGGVMDQFVENVRRFAAGQPLENQVDLAKGY
jgi:phosphoglycerate dehydrogenase-like enzyme